VVSPRVLSAAVSRRCRAVVEHLEANTISGQPRQELVAALLVAPLLEEAVFRAAPASVARRLRVGRVPLALASAAVFALMHQRFGPRFVAYAFVGGLVLWATHVRVGYPAAILVHAVANVLDLGLGWRA
jgi:membrane protease YdiL (CAAX protease family)